PAVLVVFRRAGVFSFFGSHLLSEVCNRDGGGNIVGNAGLAGVPAGRSRATQQTGGSDASTVQGRRTRTATPAAPAALSLQQPQFDQCIGSDAATEGPGDGVEAF